MNATVKKIIREEVHYALFQVKLPDVPWSKVNHPKRVCPECGTSFVPKRWFSRHDTRPCYAKEYGRKYRRWQKRQARFYAVRGGRR